MGRAGSTWSEYEDLLVRTHFPVHGSMWKEWPNVLPGRTTIAIRGRARRLGLNVENKDVWTAEEDAVLLENRGHDARWHGWVRLLPRHTPKAIANRMRFLCSSAGEWDPDEDRALLVALSHVVKYTGRTASEIYERIPKLYEAVLEERAKVPGKRES